MVPAMRSLGPRGENRWAHAKCPAPLRQISGRHMVIYFSGISVVRVLFVHIALKISPIILSVYSMVVGADD